MTDSYRIAHTVAIPAPRRLSSRAAVLFRTRSAKREAHARLMEFAFVGHPEHAVTALQRAVRTGVGVMLPGRLESQTDAPAMASAPVGAVSASGVVEPLANVARDGQTTGPVPSAPNVVR